jgi:hypothetical protein
MQVLQYCNWDIHILSFTHTLTHTHIHTNIHTDIHRHAHTHTHVPRVFGVDSYKRLKQIVLVAFDIVL